MYTVHILFHRLYQKIKRRTHHAGRDVSKEVSLTVLLLPIIPLPHLQILKVRQQGAVEQVETLLRTGVQVQLL